MSSRSGEDPIEKFVLALLVTGSVLTELAADLIDELPPEAYPGEKPASVVIEMLCGTIATGLASVDPCDVRRATELIYLAATRTREHLRIALELSRRTHRDGEGIVRTTG